MPDIDPNLTIDVTGTTASIATDYTSSGITNSHVQVVKIAYGGPSVATRVDTATPLPVTLIGQTASIGITGYITGLGNFKVINGLSGITAVALKIEGVAGGTDVAINGRVQGITNGTQMGITGSVAVLNDYIGIRGRGGTTDQYYPVWVTGGTKLNSSTDSVTVVGIVGVSGGRQLAAATDSVRAYNWDGATGIDVQLWDYAGNGIQSVSGAMKVYLVNSGITATVSINPIVGVTNSAATSLYVQGTTGGQALLVKGGLSGGAMYVGCPSNNPLPVQVTNSIEVDNTSVVDALTADTSSLISNMKQIVTNTSTVSAINTKLNSSASVFNTVVNEIKKPTTVYTSTIDVTDTKVPLGSSSLKTGITIKAAQGNDVLVEMYGVGSTSAYVLDAGESIYIETNSLSNISVKKPDNSSTSAMAKIYIIAS